MTTRWVDAFPQTAKPILEEIDDTLGFGLTRIIESGTNAELNATENSQPAIMATSILVLRILEKEFGFEIENRPTYEDKARPVGQSRIKPRSIRDEQDIDHTVIPGYDV